MEALGEGLILNVLGRWLQIGVATAGGLMVAVPLATAIFDGEAPSAAGIASLLFILLAAVVLLSYMRLFER